MWWGVHSHILVFDIWAIWPERYAVADSLRTVDVTQCVNGKRVLHSKPLFHKNWSQLFLKYSLWHQEQHFFFVKSIEWHFYFFRSNNECMVSIQN